MVFARHHLIEALQNNMETHDISLYLTDVSAYSFRLAPFDELTFERISRRGSIVRGNHSRYGY